MQEKNDRIEELEMALKESVSITAEREMVLMEEQHKMEAIKEQVGRRGDSHKGRNSWG